MQFIYENRLEYIESKILECQEMCFAISFIRYSGIRMLRPLYINSEKKRINSRILVDTRQRITEKKALKSLFDDGFKIKDHVGEGSFHPKIWLFKINNSWQAVVGSMNISVSALIHNVEAIAVLDKEESLKVKDWFDAQWKDDRYRELNLPLINELPEAYKLYFSNNKPESSLFLKDESFTKSITKKAIKEFIQEWANDTKTTGIGPSMRKTGWTFRPSHGDFNLPLLSELNRIMGAMFPKNNKEFVLTEKSASLVIHKAGIQFQRRSKKTSNKDLLMKRQINYLDKLGMVKKKNGRTWDTIIITPPGEAFLNSSESEYFNYLENALIRFEWFGVNIYDFTVSVLNNSHDHKISYIEFFIFLRHAGVSEYSYHTPEQIISLINKYRSLSDRGKEEIWEFMKKQIDKNDKSKSKTSFANMKNNWVKDMYKDLAVCSEFCLIDKDSKQIDVRVEAPKDFENTFLTLR